MYPTFRSVKESSKNSSSTFTPTMPAGTVSGDLLLMYVVLKQAAGAPPTVTTPTGWTSQGTIATTEPERRCYLFTRESNGTTPEIVCSGEASTIYATIVAITKGTFNATISVVGAWVEEKTTTPFLPQIKTIVPECLAVSFFRCSTALTGKPEEGWVNQGELTDSGDVFTKEIAGEENTPKGKATKATSISSTAITIAISSPVEEKTLAGKAAVKVTAASSVTAQAQPAPKAGVTIGAKASIQSGTFNLEGTANVKVGTAAKLAAQAAASGQAGAKVGASCALAYQTTVAASAGVVVGAKATIGKGAPVVRSFHETQSKTGVTELATVLPSAVVGDILVMIVAVQVASGTAPTITTPAGWTERGSINITTTSIRRLYLFTQEYTGGAAPVLKASGEAKTIYASIASINGGYAIPNAITAWVEESTTTPALPSVKTTVPECLVLSCISSNAALTKPPEEGWSALQEAALAGDIYTQLFIAEGNTSKGKATKGSAAASGAITIAIAPIAERTIAATAHVKTPAATSVAAEAQPSGKASVVVQAELTLKYESETEKRLKGKGAVKVGAACALAYQVAVPLEPASVTVGANAGLAYPEGLELFAWAAVSGKAAAKVSATSSTGARAGLVAKATVHVGAQQGQLSAQAALQGHAGVVINGHTSLAATATLAGKAAVRITTYASFTGPASVTARTGVRVGATAALAAQVGMRGSAGVIVGGHARLIEEAVYTIYATVSTPQSMYATVKVNEV